MSFMSMVCESSETGEPGELSEFSESIQSGEFSEFSESIEHHELIAHNTYSTALSESLLPSSPSNI